MEKVLWFLAVCTPVLCLLGMHSIEQNAERFRWERDRWRLGNW